MILVALAHAATECMSVDDFNDYMLSHDPSTSVVLNYDATGVNPNDWPGTKGALADLTDSTCAAGGSLALKVYGPDDPPNTSHPTGTLKQEYGYNCGPMPNEEHWADPNASEVVFVDGSERCDVTIWIDPATFGYILDCDHGYFVGEADNGPAMPVNYITLFSLVDGSTWKMKNATSTWNEVCFETSEPVEEVPDTAEDGVVDAIQDVTAAIDPPGAVYSDVRDLCVEAGYSEVYVQFDLSSIEGRVTSAVLELTAGSDSSANGSGTDVYLAASSAWSEDTLTWNTRPGTAGSKLDRAAPVSAGESYTLDVSSAVSAPATYSFALVPDAADTNGSHFVSTEAGANGPKLHVTWEPTDDGGGDDDGGGTDDTDVDDGEPGDGGGEDDDPVDTGDASGPSTAPGEANAIASGDCGCDAGSNAGAWGLVLGATTLLRRRRG